MGLTLVLGGVRSGKSAFAESLLTPPALYVATMRPETGDDARIERHRERRGDGWRTVVADQGVAAAASGAAQVLLDGFGLVVASALGREHPKSAVGGEVDAIIAVSRTAQWVIVSEETGLGLLGGDSLSRHYQDLLGEANQRFANAAARVVLVVAGRPLDLPRA